MCYITGKVLKKKKVAIKLPCDPAIPLLGLDQRELKTLVHMKARASRDGRVERARLHPLTIGEGNVRLNMDAGPTWASLRAHPPAAQ